MNIPTEEDGAGKAPPVEYRIMRPTYVLRPSPMTDEDWERVRNDPRTERMVEHCKRVIDEDMVRKVNRLTAAEMVKTMPSPAPLPLEVTVFDEDPFPRRHTLYAYDPWPVVLNPPHSVVLGAL